MDGLQSTKGRYVIVAKKADCCSCEPGKKEYYFVNGSNELVSELARLMSHYGGDNDGLHIVRTPQEAEDFGVPSPAEVATRPVYVVKYNGGDSYYLVADDFDSDELKLAENLCGECGDWSLTFFDEDELDQIERQVILEANDDWELARETAINAAWERLW